MAILLFSCKSVRKILIDPENGETFLVLYLIKRRLSP